MYAVLDEKDCPKFVSSDEYNQYIAGLFTAKFESIEKGGTASGEQICDALNGVRSDLDSVQHRLFGVMSRLSLTEDEKTAFKNSVVKGMDVKSEIGAMNNHAIASQLVDKSFMVTGFSAALVAVVLDHEVDGFGGEVINVAAEEAKDRHNREIENRAAKMPDAMVFYDYKGYAEMSVSKMALNR